MFILLLLPTVLKYYKFLTIIYLYVNSSCLHYLVLLHDLYVLKYAIWDLLVTYILVHRVNDRLSATVKLQTRLYKDRTSAANSSDSEG